MECDKLCHTDVMQISHGQPAVQNSIHKKEKSGPNSEISRALQIFETKQWYRIYIGSRRKNKDVGNLYST